MRRLRRKFADWWLFRDLRALDVDIAGGGDQCFVLAHTGRRFKRVVSIEMSRDEFELLAEQIRDLTDDDHPCCDGLCVHQQPRMAEQRSRKAEQ